MWQQCFNLSTFGLWWSRQLWWQFSDEKFCSCTKSQRNNKVGQKSCMRTAFRNQKLLWKIRKARKGKSQFLSFSDVINKGLIIFNTSAKYEKQENCQSTNMDTPVHNLSFVLKLLGQNNKYDDKYPNVLLCKTGDQQSFNVSDICVYRLNKQTIACPCLDGTHLADCKEFECNMMFKCPYYYCIPWQYMCDKKWDCPQGTDEISCLTLSCTNMFKCDSLDTVCIHLGQVCNGLEECPQGEDETLCDLKELACPIKCQCLMVSLLCYQIDILPSERIQNFCIINVHHCIVQIKSLLSLTHAVYYTLIDTNVTITCNLFAKSLVGLSVQQNIFHTVETNCFNGCLDLKNIKLMKNKIQFLAPLSFANLSSLELLNISYNLLSNVPSNSFLNLPTLKMFSLLGNELTDIKINAFEQLNLDVLETLDYHICCLVSSSTHCNATRPWYISCSDLLPNISLRATFITMSIFVIVLNIISVLLFLATQTKKNRSNVVVTISVNIIEFFCGIYLCILWSIDISQKESFILFEESWRSSFGCQTASFFLVLFSIADPAFLLLLSIARYMIVKCPLDTQFKSVKFVFQWISFLGFTSILLSAGLGVVFYFTIGTMPTSLCIIFVDPTNVNTFSVITTIVIASAQLITSVTIIIVYSLLLKERNESKNRVGATGQSSQSNKSLIIQLLLITLSNIFCWMPTNIVYLISLFLPRYPSEMVVWTAVAVAPINAFVNPSVFIFTSVRTVCRKRKDNKTNKEVLEMDKAWATCTCSIMQESETREKSNQLDSLWVHFTHSVVLSCMQFDNWKAISPFLHENVMLSFIFSFVWMFMLQPWYTFWNTCELQQSTCFFLHWNCKNEGSTGLKQFRAQENSSNTQDMGTQDVAFWRISCVSFLCFVPLCNQPLSCCDITNAQFGISKETALRGGNLAVYWTIAHHLVVIVTNSVRWHRTTLLLHWGCWHWWAFCTYMYEILQ